MWLKDLLPKRVGAVRVMSFIYEVNTEHGISAQDVSRLARYLLHRLSETPPSGKMPNGGSGLNLSRTTDETDLQTRNLVFIGHGFGGVIIKQVIND